MKEIILGIDLGTTNSEVAVIENGRVKIVTEKGNQILPSFVGLDENGAILVGEAARNQYRVYPERTIKSIKRLMGSGEQISLGDKSYSPPEISAIILKKLKLMAEEHLGCAVTKAVITVPAYFSDAQRQATRDAGEIAGLEVVKIINEPTAAALSYESGHKERKRVLVYDLGGGTFDVSVVEIEDDIIEVVSSHGNNCLGGDDFDQKIIDYLLKYLYEEQGVATSDMSSQALARLDRAAEAAKCSLSDHPFVQIEEEYLLEHNGIPVNLALEFSRDDYEMMIMPFVDETLEATHIALSGAGLTVSDIDEVLLVGGATRTPLVQRMLHNEFGSQPRSEVNPDLCVATGAATQAAMLAGEKVSTVLVDITPYTFGTSSVYELNGMPYPYFFVPIIPKNTPIPVTKSEVFYTMVNNQEKVLVSIYQGENPDALQNIKIGEFIIGGLSKVEAGNEIINQLSLDTDGILHVTAREKKTGLEKKITIENAFSSFDAEELTQAKERIGRLFGAGEENSEDNFENNEYQTIVQAKALIEKAQRMLEEASADDREEMIDLIEVISDTLGAGDLDSLNAPVEELSEILFYLET
jgi:molecular chaperone DnaK (HSP70)